MKTLKTRLPIGLALLLLVAGAALAALPVSPTSDDSAPPALPAPTCDRIQVPAGNELFFHAYARGVQKYRWDGSSWVFVAPDATLYGDAGLAGQVGIHYAGPTWESNSGSQVKAARKDSCPAPDPAAIDWLLLEATTTNGPGVFRAVSYIQRVNTAGGKAPARAGTAMDEAAEVPYTAEYYFYRAED